MKFNRAWVLGGIAASIWFGGMPAFSHGAAAKAKGVATTSGQVTSADPALKQIQLTIDPASSGGPYAVSDFSLVVNFDPTLLVFQSVTAAPNYEAYQDSETSLPGYGILQIDGDSLQLNSGPPSDPSSVVTGDVNLFVLDFTLAPGATDDTPLIFTIGGGQFDYVVGENPFNTDDTVEADGSQVATTTVTTTINQAAADIAAGAGSGSAAPLPASPLAGGLGLIAAGVILAWTKRKGVKMPAI